MQRASGRRKARGRVKGGGRSEHTRAGCEGRVLLLILYARTSKGCVFCACPRRASLDEVERWMLEGRGAQG